MAAEATPAAARSPAARAVLAGIAALVTWELLARLFDQPLLVPWPSWVFGVSFPSLAIFGGAPGPDVAVALATVGRNVAVTFTRIVAGVLAGVASGVAVGAAAHLASRHCRHEPALLVALRSVPLFGLIPLFVLWFGGSETGVWTYIAFSVAIIVATGTYQAIDNVPQLYLLQSRLLGASSWQRFTTVVMPAMLPELAGTLRNVLGLSWAFSLGAEYAAASDGLGRLVYLSYTYADMGKIAALAAVYGMGGLLVFFAWNRLSNRSRRRNQPTGTGGNR